MRFHRAYCIAALVLLAASLLLVAIDGLAGPAEKHGPGNCPICTWASCLATAEVPERVLWTEPATLRWAPEDPVCVARAEFLWRPFSARSPPRLAP